LIDVGLHQPDDDAKARALEAYDTMIATLERIRHDVLGFSHTKLASHRGLLR